MLRLIYVIGLFCCASLLHAQNEPEFTTDGFSMLSNNPSTIGSYCKLESNAVFGVYAPGNGTSYHSQINFAHLIDLARLEKIQIGFGAQHTYQSYNLSHYNNFYLPLTARILWDKMEMSFGYAIGLTNCSNFQHFESDDSLANAFLPKKGNQSSLNHSLGLNINNEKFYFAVGMSPVQNNYLEDLKVDLFRSWYLQTGYRHSLKNGLVIFPQLNLQLQGGFSKLSGMLYFQAPEEIVSFGLGGTLPLNTLNFALRVKVKQIALHYVSHIEPFISGNSFNGHEIRLSYLIGKD